MRLESGGSDLNRHERGSAGALQGVFALKFAKNVAFHPHEKKESSVRRISQIPSFCASQETFKL